MPLTENDIKAELSYAYLHAVAARAGFGCEVTGRPSDNAGVDAYVRVKERLAENAKYTNFPFEVQLKATSKTPALEADRYSFWLDDVVRYDDLRAQSAPMPKILVVLFLPTDASQWLEHTNEGVVTRRCAYWVSLWNAPASGNQTGQTVYLPKSNVLSVDGLRSLAQRLACEEEIPYGG
jgi:hypothetical protein